MYLLLNDKKTDNILLVYTLFLIFLYINDLASVSKFSSKIDTICQDKIMIFEMYLSVCALLDR